MIDFGAGKVSKSGAWKILLSIHRLGVAFSWSEENKKEKFSLLVESSQQSGWRRSSRRWFMVAQITRLHHVKASSLKKRTSCKNSMRTVGLERKLKVFRRVKVIFLLAHRTQEAFCKHEKHFKLWFWQIFLTFFTRNVKKNVLRRFYDSRVFVDLTLFTPLDTIFQFTLLQIFINLRVFFGRTISGWTRTFTDCQTAKLLTNIVDWSFFLFNDKFLAKLLELVN